MLTVGWDEIEKDLKLGTFLITVAAQSLLPDRHPLVGQFGGVALGPDYDPKVSAAYQVDEIEHLEAFDVSKTQFWKVARACFDFVHDRTPLDQVDHRDFKDDTLNWMTYFLSAIPRDSYATAMGEYSSRFAERRDKGDEFPLPGLHLAAAAKANLIDYLRAFPGNPEIDLGFAPFEIAALAGMNISSVRNFIGPSGKPVRSMPLDKSFGVHGDPLDALEWLAGRRNFDAGPLSPDWAVRAGERARTLEDVGAIIGVFAWTNRITTEQLAARSGLSTAVVHAWTRGEVGSSDDAAALADAAGIDPEIYTDLVARHGGATARI